MEKAERLAEEARRELVAQGLREGSVRIVQKAHLKYEGTDTALGVPLGTVGEMTACFEAAHRKQFSFRMPGKPLIVEAVSVEAISAGESYAEKVQAQQKAGTAADMVKMFTGGKWHEAPVHRREQLVFSNNGPRRDISTVVRRCAGAT